jgi:NAD kinase
MYDDHSFQCYLCLMHGHDLTFYDFLIIADKETFLLHTKVDLVVTLGGDGTVLWVCAFAFLLTLSDKSEYVIALTY